MFEKIDSLRLGHLNVNVYRSSASGMTVVHGDVPGPLVSCAIVVGTEARDHDGLPHTLEHLVFLGSKNYPYKGVLDKLANLAIADGTNAWTAVDHTAYTLETGGKGGFLNMLPIYMDHILNPTLTEAGFVTEVFHIDGDGKDGGVVFCEMLGRENDGDEIATHALQELAWGDPSQCGYASETGGLVANIRTLSIEKIRAYHRKYYHAANVCVVVCGQLDAAEIFTALADVELDANRDGAEQPWLDTVPAMRSDNPIKRVEFPDTNDEEDQVGIILWSKRIGAYTDFDERTAIEVLAAYLTESQVSPLKLAFVQRENPLASSVAIFGHDDCAPLLTVQFDDVDLERIDEMRDELLRSLSETTFDMSRMRDLIAMRKVEIMECLEAAPDVLINSLAIGCFLAARDHMPLSKSGAVLARLDALAARDASFWSALLRRCLMDGPHVTVQGVPSAELAKQQEAAEEARLVAQRERLGPDGLAQCSKRLEEAKVRNDAQPPEPYTLPPTDVAAIPLHGIETRHGDQIDATLPFCTQLDIVDTQFCALTVYLDTRHMSVEQRVYLCLFAELLFKLPHEAPNSEPKTHEEVVKGLDRDLVDYGTGLGTSQREFSTGSYAALVSVMCKCVADKLHLGVQWLRDSLFFSKLNVERVRIAADRLAQSAKAKRRNGSYVAFAAVKDMCLERASNVTLVNAVRQQQFLERITERLTSDEAGVLGELEEFRRALLANTTSMRVHLACGASMAADGANLLKNLVPDDRVVSPSLVSRNVSPAPRSRLHSVAATASRCLAVEVGSMDTACLYLASSGVSEEHVDVAALEVAIPYVCSMEGPLWVAIRGPGFAYGYDIWFSTDMALIYFSLSRSSALLDAMDAARETLSTIASTPIDAHSLQSAKCAAIYGVLGEVSTVESAASTEFWRTLNGVAPSIKQRLANLQAVSADDVRRVLNKWLLPLVTSTSVRRCAVASNASLLQPIVDGLRKRGFEECKLVSVSECFL